MNVEKDIDTRKLHQRIAHLEENRRFIQNALEMALSLGDFQQNINNGYGPEKIIQETDARVQHLFPFDATALYLVDENKSDFKLGVCDSADLKAFLDTEVESMIDKGFFAWAVREKRGIFVPSKDRSRRFVLHVIATSSRIRGMFVGLLAGKGKKIPDSALILLSIVLLNTASALESYEFYKFMRDQNKILRQKIEERTRELARSERQLQQIDKIQAIGTLAGGIAHDFNNILFPISGYTEMSIDDTPENSEIRKNLEKVLKATGRARDLVEQILTFSRQSSQEYKPLRIQPIIKEAFKLLRATLPTTIEINQNIDSRCGATTGNPTQIHQVIMNLCTNAFQAMQDKGGRLEVNLSEVDIGADDILEKMGMKPGKYIRLGVIDTGQGMEPAVLARIFEPYFTTKDQGKGTGLGLSVTHGIVKSHGGDIKVYSEPGKGTKFHVYFPLIDHVATEAAPVSTQIAARGTEHILLIDDEAQIVQMEQQMLQRLGYHVTIRTSSVDALDTFRKQPHKFDLVITDMTMPDMTGMDLAPQLLKIRPDIPIIICSGFSEVITEDKVKSIGIREFIQKPIAINDLAMTMRKVLGNKES
ncbi:MAG: ATP-binding protein [Planctomycetota bacterium]|jgi:signal transduction histidine kinase/ActR/RegA family two-component response regulator